MSEGLSAVGNTATVIRDPETNDMVREREKGDVVLVQCWRHVGVGLV